MPRKCPTQVAIRLNLNEIGKYENLQAICVQKALLLSYEEAKIRIRSTDQ